MPKTKEAFQQVRDKSRQHILDEAAKVFAKQGLANTKVSDLAEAAGVSQGLLYRYFADKDGVFIALLEQAINQVTEYAQTAVKQKGTPLEKLHWLTKQIVQDMSQEPIYLRLFSQAVALPGKAQDTLMKLDMVSKILRELIFEGQTTGEIVNLDPDQLVFLYFSCLYGLATGKSINIRWIDEHFPTAERVLQIFKP